MCALIPEDHLKVGCDGTECHGNLYQGSLYFLCMETIVVYQRGNTHSPWKFSKKPKGDMTKTIWPRVLSALCHNAPSFP